MSVWVEDVDEVHRECVAAGLEVTFPPTAIPMECPGDAPETSGWSCVQDQPG
jgi:hypothetical protein